MMGAQTTVREKLRSYMSRSGMTARDVAEETGYTRSTIVQFISSSHFGCSDRETGATALKLCSWMEENPLPIRELPGKFYETAATREIDRLIAHAKAGGWGELYGPAGGQKTFTLQTRAAEAAMVDGEPAIALIEVMGAWSPRTLFKALAAELGIGLLYNSADDCQRGILRALRRRKSPVAIVFDEADLLYGRIDTLQAMRRLADLAAGRAGLLVAGNEEVEQLFEPRRKSYMEQWRSRIEQEKIRVLGPTRAEARAMISGEAPHLAPEKADRLLDGCTVKDPVTKRDYVSTRRLFNALEVGRRNGRKAN